MNWRLCVRAGTVLAALIAFPGVIAAQNTGPTDEPGGKSKIHHVKVFTVADEAARALKDAEEQAYEVTDHIGTIQAANSFSNAARELYSSELEAMAEDIDLLGKELGQLEALQQNETSWERRTVTRSRPLLKQVAATTDEAIRYVNEHPDRLGMPECQKITKKLYDQSTVLWKSLHDSIRLANLRERETRLKAKFDKSDKTSD